MTANNFFKDGLNAKQIMDLPLYFFDKWHAKVLIPSTVKKKAELIHL